MNKIILPGTDLGDPNVKITDPNPINLNTGSGLITNLTDPTAIGGNTTENSASGLTFDAQGRPLDVNGNVIPANAMNTIFQRAAQPPTKEDETSKISPLDTAIIGGKQIILKIKLITETTFNDLLNL